jgi:hypothetical protein
MALLHKRITPPQCCGSGRPTVPDIARRRFIIDDGQDGERVAIGWAWAGQRCTLAMLTKGPKSKPAGEWQTTVTIIAQSSRARTRAAAGSPRRLP